MKEDNPGDFSSYVLETPFMQKERIKETEQIIEDLKADMKKLEKALEKHVEKCGTGFRHKELLRKHKAKYGV